MNFNDLTSKELEHYLNLAKKRKAQLSADLNTAQRQYVVALGSPTSLEYRQELYQKADSIKVALNKTNVCIAKIKARLGANIVQGKVTPSITGENAAKTITESVRADSTPLSTSKKSAARLNHRARKIINLLKVQLTPSTVCVEPNDSIIKAIFGNSHSKISVKEKHKSKRKNAVVSNIKVEGAAVTDTPLDEFDRAVLGVIVSEYDVNNRYTTVNIIHRALIGKPGQVAIVPSKDQRNAIFKAVNKLRLTDVDFSDVSNSLKKLKYTDKDGNELILRKDNLISAGIFDAKVNGQPVEDVIYFKDSCPLFDIANLKDQVIRYPHELLNVPNQNNTPLVIALKKYVIRRICEIKLHKQLTPTITFDDVFSKCKVNADNQKKRQRARDVIIQFFEHLKSKNFISDFNLKKDGKKFTAISFKFDPQK